MQTIAIDNALYADAQAYASANNISVEQWIASLIVRFIPSKEKHYKMKTMQELSPELLQYVGFAKPTSDEDDLNGEKARDEYLVSKYN